MSVFDCKKENNIKGVIAETIIQEMFKDMNYYVHRAGMEYSTPAFANRRRIFSDDTTDKLIRHFPDFIIEREDKVFLIEVKYRQNNKYYIQDYKEEHGCDYPYIDAFIILVSPYSIRCAKVSDLMKNDGRYQLLGNMEEFETDRHIIRKYIEFCKKYFSIKEPEYYDK